jgi:tRNA(Ile)-lysidine synthase
MLNAVTTQLLAIGCNKVVLALSGGLDSMVLLHLLEHWQQQEQGRHLSAVYVHHGLSPNADAWGEFCAARCALLQVPFVMEKVQLGGENNLEAKAREARYKVLSAAIISSDTALCTAHHADDQLETLLLALKRGSGAAGLAGIAAAKPFAKGWLVRPLLDFNRSELEAVAIATAIPFITDESNANPAFDRNFLRLEVLPLLRQRFGAIAKTSSRSMQQLGALQQANDYLLAPLLSDMQHDQQLDLAKLQQHPLPVQQLLLRAFLQQFALNPSTLQLGELFENLIAAKADAQPLICMNDHQLRRFANKLYLLTPQELQKQTQQQQCLTQTKLLQLKADAETTLPDGRVLVWQAEGFAPQTGLCQWPLALPVTAELTVDFAGYSRKFKPACSAVSKPLKQWLQLWKVPPWQRGSVPFIIAGQQIVVVAGYASHCTEQQAQSWLCLKTSKATKL